MAINSIGYRQHRSRRTSVRNLNDQLTDLSDATHHRQEVDDLFRHGRQRRLCDRRARATVEHLRLHRHHDQDQHQRSTSPTPRCSRWPISATQVQNASASILAGAEQSPGRPCAAERGRCAIRIDGRHPQHAVRRPLCVFRQRASTRRRWPTADDILNGSGAQAGLEAGHFRTQPGRSRRQRPRAPRAVARRRRRR